MADVGPQLARSAQADDGVQVRAVHVDLAAVVVNDAADVADGLLKDTVR